MEVLWQETFYFWCWSLHFRCRSLHFWCWSFHFWFWSLPFWYWSLHFFAGASAFYTRVSPFDAGNFAFDILALAFDVGSSSLDSGVFAFDDRFWFHSIHFSCWSLIFGHFLKIKALQCLFFSVIFFLKASSFFTIVTKMWKCANLWKNIEVDVRSWKTYRHRIEPDCRCCNYFGNLIVLDANSQYYIRNTIVIAKVGIEGV